MSALIIPTPKPKPATRLVTALVALAFILAAAPIAHAQLIYGSEITQVAPQGFGDRQNSISWGMAWWPCSSPTDCKPWQNKLYVGTGRSIFCVQQATLQFYNPDNKFYPPKDKEIVCTPDAHDLPLQAEIWRWTPETNQWDRVYQSPNNVLIPGTSPPKYTAADIGFRGMTIFKETDGTEALYISGDSTRGGAGVGFDGPVPPPRILRTVDGVHFDPIPFDPDQVLGSPLVSGFRSLKIYNGKLYVMGTVGQLGHGILLEAKHPELGDFRQVSGFRPDGKLLTFFEIEVYNGFLWAGTGVQPQNDPTPFSLLKTDASGEPPYTFTTVIPAGAYRKRNPAPAVVSMSVLNNRLFVGTDREVLRVNPDNSWDLVTGSPRTAPDGTKLLPLSGFEDGFDNFFNLHMWRMTVHSTGSGGPWLYVGTNDTSTKWRNLKGIGDMLKPTMGFDIFATSDGWHYTAVTLDGLDDIHNTGLRNFASTPYGLFFGTANHYHGTEVYKGLNAANAVGTPRRLEVESASKIAGLTWEGSPTATRFHVFRQSGYAAATEIGVTDATLPTGRGFVDQTLQPFKAYRYYVVAEDAQGDLSQPSNMVRAPFQGPVPTFKSLETLLTGWAAPPAITGALAAAKTAVQASDWPAALVQLQVMEGLILAPNQNLLLPYRAEDLGVLLAKFARRVVLAQTGALPAKMLMK
jgi:hypothetical protein